MANLIGNPDASVQSTMDDINVDGSTPANPETLNSRYQLLLNNDASLKRSVQGLEAAVEPRELVERVKYHDGQGSGLDADMIDGKHAYELIEPWKRFQLSGSVQPGLSLAAKEIKPVYSVPLGLTSAHRVLLGFVRYNAAPNLFRLRVEVKSYFQTGGNIWNDGQVYELYDGVGAADLVTISLVNTQNSTQTVTSPVSWWLDMEIKTP